MVSLQATLDSSARASNRRECFFPLTFLNRPPNSKIIVRVLMVGAGLLSDPAVVLEFGYRHEFGDRPECAGVRCARRPNNLASGNAEPSGGLFNRGFGGAST